MRRAVIFLHGDKPSKESIRHIKKSDKIICADGGAIWAEALGLDPDVYIGDLDSISPALYKKLQKQNIEFHLYEKDKDETDSELALEYAVNSGFREILILGVIGSRIDHMLANLTLLTEKAMEGVRIQLIAEKQSIYFVTDSIQLRGKKGEFVSLIPIKSDVKGVTTRGLKWQLYNDTLAFGKSLGISNELVVKKATIEVAKGILMVIHTKE
jgi:thiamine pyrophosphokinase